VDAFGGDGGDAFGSSGVDVFGGGEDGGDAFASVTGGDVFGSSQDAFAFGGGDDGGDAFATGGDDPFASSSGPQLFETVTFEGGGGEEEGVDDMELARRLQAEEDAMGSPGVSMTPGQESIPVRSPRSQQAFDDEEMARRLQREMEMEEARAAPPAPPPAPTPAQGTYLSLEIIDIALGEKMKLGDVSVKVTVQDPSGKQFDVQTTQPLPAPSGAVDTFNLKRTVNLKQPLEDVSPESSVIIEFKHYKQSEQKLSVRCWALTDLNRLYQSSGKGSMDLPLFKKPTSFDGNPGSALNKGGAFKVRVTTGNTPF